MSAHCLLKQIYLLISEIPKPPNGIKISVFNGIKTKTEKEIEIIKMSINGIILKVLGDVIYLPGYQATIFKKLWDKGKKKQPCIYTDFDDLDPVWKEDPQCIHRYVYEIRKKIGKKYIKTMRGIGYRMPERYLGKDPS